MRLEIQNQTTSKADEILPEAAVLILPFSKEPIADWVQDTDLISFLFELYEGTGYGDVAFNYFEETITQFEAWARIFFEAASEASPSPASVNKDVKIPDFLQNESFGLLAKCSSAWNNTIGNILSEGSYFSLSHILETRTDLASSIHLAAHLYYRQAYQVLRGFLESVILPLHFCSNPKDYKKWKLDSYHTPPLRGKKGLIKSLVREGVIDSSLAEKISDIYGQLNSYIHGSENSMNNKGVNTGNWAGFVFQEREFNQWVNVYSTCVEVGIKVLRLHHQQIEKLKPINENSCSVCHGIDFIVMTENTEAELIKSKCTTCGFETNQNKDGEQVILSTIEFEE